ncbi:hypothetical protein G6F68_020425 [Rhizopus microsporus]|nr:hypothetical protein G6F68_020425 [Rhizopus microsporus]
MARTDAACRGRPLNRNSHDACLRNPHPGRPARGWRALMAILDGPGSHRRHRERRRVPAGADRPGPAGPGPVGHLGDGRGL